MLVTQPRVDVVRTRVYRSSEVRPAEVKAIYADLEASVVDRFSQDGDQDGTLSFQRKADLRYHGQEHTVPVLVGADPLDIAKIEADFHEAHKRLYTFRLPDTPVEFVNFQVIGCRQVPTPELSPIRVNGSRGDHYEVGRRLVDFDVDGLHDTVIYARDQLPAGFSAAGPLIVEEPAATTLVHPRQSLSVDSFGNLTVHLEP